MYFHASSMRTLAVAGERGSCVRTRDTWVMRIKWAHVWSAAGDSKSKFLACRVNNVINQKTTRHQAPGERERERRRGRTHTDRDKRKRPRRHKERAGGGDCNAPGCKWRMRLLTCMCRGEGVGWGRRKEEGVCLAYGERQLCVSLRFTDPTNNCNWAGSSSSSRSSVLGELQNGTSHAWRKGWNLATLRGSSAAATSISLPTIEISQTERTNVGAIKTY